MPLAKVDERTPADILAAFMAQNDDPTDDGPGANDPLMSAGLRHTRDMENRERMVNDPTNPRYQMVDKFIQQDEGQDPYSQTSSLARLSKAQDATDVMNRFMGQQPMRNQQQKDAGALAQSAAYGTAEGKYEADVGTEGVQSLDNARDRQLAVEQAKNQAKAALTNKLTMSNILSSGEVTLPNGMKSDSGNALVNSERAQQIFKQNGAEEGTQGIVGLILDYKLTPPQAAALARSGQMQKYLGLAKAVDPQFDASSFETGMKLRADMTTGQAAKQIQSLRRIKEHMGTLRQGIDELGNANTGSGLINPLVNWWQSQMRGDSKYNDYMKEQNIVDAEAANAMNASGQTSDASRHDQAAGVNANSSYNIQKGHANVTEELLKGQAIALRNKVGAVPRLLPLLDELLKDVNTGNAPAQETTTAPTPVANATPYTGTPFPPAGTPRMLNGQRWVSDGTKFVPEGKR